MVSQQAFFPAELSPHTLFRKRYFIISKVGAGGFGSVYKATDIQSGDRLVAIKEVSLLGLHPQAMIEATTTFQREVSLVIPIRSSHICHASMSTFRPLDIGTWSWTSSLVKHLRNTRARHPIGAFS